MSASDAVDGHTDWFNLSVEVSEGVQVVALQQRKRDLFAQVVDDEAMTGGALTAEDIRGLFA